MKSPRVVLVCAVAVALAAAQVQAGVIFQETFPTDTADTAETVATYTNSVSYTHLTLPTN